MSHVSTQTSRVHAHCGRYFHWGENLWSVNTEQTCGDTVETSFAWIIKCFSLDALHSFLAAVVIFYTGLIAVVVVVIKVIVVVVIKGVVYKNKYYTTTTSIVFVLIYRIYH